MGKRAESLREAMVARHEEERVALATKQLAELAKLKELVAAEQATVKVEMGLKDAVFGMQSYVGSAVLHPLWRALIRFRQV